MNEGRELAEAMETLNFAMRRMFGVQGVNVEAQKGVRPEGRIEGLN
jgi:hypothetical protein